MALGDAYITREELADYIQATESTSAQDTELDRVISAVSRLVERYCGRVFNDAGSVSARVYDAFTPRVVKVDDFSTTTGLVVKVDSGNDSSYGTTVAATKYTALPLNGIVDGQTGHPYTFIRTHTGYLFPVRDGTPLIEVTARWGWAAVPDDIKSACLMQGARVVSRKYTPGGVAGFGDFTVRVPSQLDPDVRELLNPYRKHDRVA